jgi:hypothetical protein
MINIKCLCSYSTQRGLLLRFACICIVLFSCFVSAAKDDDSSGSDLVDDGDGTNSTTGERRIKLIQADPWYSTESANSYSGNYDDFWDELDCDDVLGVDESAVRPIPNQSTWTLLRGVYLGIVGPSNSTIEVQDIWLSNGFQVPVKVDQIPGKGRGVVALQDIPEGTFILKDLHTARFRSPVEYRRFLVSIHKEWACDVMGLWAYTEDYSFEDDDDDDDDDDEEEETTATLIRQRPVISVDLDDGTFINTADSTTPKNIDHLTYTATRLIQAGEELIVDYGDFEKAGSWDAAGFGSTCETIEDHEDW